MYEVLLTKTAKRGFDTLPKKLQIKCKNKLQELKTNPQLGKKLIGELSAYRSIRLTNYRIVYRVEKEKVVIFVVSIRHRKDVYKKLS